jgi:uncharacterized membrane protein
MKWLTLSLLLAAGNIVLLSLFAAGRLEPIPLLLPACLALFAICAAAGSTVAAVRYRREAQLDTMLLLASIVLWGSLVPANLSVYHWGVL